MVSFSVRVESNGYFIGCRDTVVLINKVAIYVCYAADLKESYTLESGC